jgi:stage II sporulation protein D
MGAGFVAVRARAYAISRLAYQGIRRMRNARSHREEPTARGVLNVMRRSAFLGLFGSGVVGLGIGAVARASPPSMSVPLPIVRVRLFSGERIVRVDISCAEAMTYSSAGSTQIGTSFAIESAGQGVAIHANAPIDVMAHRDDGTTIEHSYLGALAILQDESALDVVNQVELESYVPSVMMSEISAGWHPEALKAQAVAVRTYAMRRTTRKNAALATYDLTDDTSNQVYKGVLGIAASLTAAAAATRGIVLGSGGLPIDVWYHSACGGHTAASVEVTGTASPPYLAGAPDVDATARAYCAASPYYSWRNRIAADALGRIFAPTSGSPVTIGIIEKWPDGRAKTVRATFADGSTIAVDGHKFYARASATLGYKVIPSAMFDIAGPSGNAYEISGHGVGHGVGMCQWGAHGRALAGATAEAILGSYFPGTSMAILTS